MEAGSSLYHSFSCMIKIFQLHVVVFLSWSPGPNLNFPYLYHNFRLQFQQSSESCRLRPSKPCAPPCAHQHLAAYLEGQGCHAAAATHAGCGWHSSGLGWGSTLPPPVLPRGSLRIRTTADRRRDHEEPGAHHLPKEPQTLHPAELTLQYSTPFTLFVLSYSKRRIHRPGMPKW